MPYIALCVFSFVIFNVFVLDPVTEEKIICDRNASMATLHCEAKGDSLSYSWSGPELQTDGQSGPQISEEKDQDSDYTCVVNNPVSKRTVLYHANDCFPSGNYINLIYSNYSSLLYFCLLYCCRTVIFISMYWIAFHIAMEFCDNFSNGN